VLKLAVLFCVSEHQEPQKKYSITNENLEKAIILGRWLVDQAGELAQTGFIKSRTEVAVQKLLTLASRDGGIQRQRAMQNMHLTAREFDTIVQTAVERGELRVEKEQGISKPSLYYRAVPKETSDD
jgi:hypothetical protein